MFLARRDYCFYRTCVQRYRPFGLPTYSRSDSYMIDPKAAEAPLSRVKEHKGTGPDEIPN